MFSLNYFTCCDVLYKTLTVDHVGEVPVAMRSSRNDTTNVSTVGVLRQHGCCHLYTAVASVSLRRQHRVHHSWGMSTVQKQKIIEFGIASGGKNVPRQPEHCVFT